MNLLDEQMRDDQRVLLSRWRIPVRQIGREIGLAGTKDHEIIPLLLTLKKPTLFTHDRGFFRRDNLHPRYCIVWLDVPDTWAAHYIRLFLKQPRFCTHARRMGVIARTHASGIHFWQTDVTILQQVRWIVER
jgi:hypothetical protein